MENQKVLILDFGGQYNQLIARRVRECNVYCEVHPYDMPLEEIRAYNPIGIIFTGGPSSVYEEGAPRLSREIFELGIPILGICYGVQVMAYTLGGTVEPGKIREYGRKPVKFDTKCAIFDGLPEEAEALMSHNDTIYELPEGFQSAGVTDSCPVAAMFDEARHLYGMQFHPEVTLTENGTAMIRNFLYKVCDAVGDWNMKNVAEYTIEAIRKAWNLRHDLTSSDARNYSLSAGTRKKDSYEYSGEFAVRIAGSETAEDGSLASLTVEVRNGFGYSSGNTSVPGRFIVSGRTIGMGSYLKQTLSASDYDLDNLYVWHKINLEDWSGDSALPRSYVFTNSFETPKEENDSSDKSFYYTLLAVIREGVVYQTHFGPIVITDRYFDESDLEEK